MVSSTSAGCDVKAELRNQAFYTIVPLPTDFQCLLLLSARNALGRPIIVYEPFFSGVKIYCCFQGISDETGPKLLKFIRTKESFYIRKEFNFQRNFLHTNMAAVTSCKKTNLYQKTSEFKLDSLTS